jgi:hypothetical protein
VPPEAGPEQGITLVTNVCDPYVNTEPGHATDWARFNPEDTATGPGAWPAVENSAESAPKERQETGPTLPRRTDSEANESDKPEPEARTSDPPETGPEEGVKEETNTSGTSVAESPDEEAEESGSEDTESVE